MQSTRDPRPIRTLYIAIARRAQAFLNFCTAGRLNYWQNRRAIEASGLFSEDYYVARYGHLIPPKMPALKHYLTRPWNMPFNPNAEFDSAWYLQAYPEVAHGRHHPLVDYVRHGQRHRRRTHVYQPPSLEQLQNALTDLATHRLKCLLDTAGTIAILTSERPLVSILLLLHNRAELTLLCLESIAVHCGVPIEVVIVDNASTDATPSMLDRINGIRVCRNEENIGFGPAGNQAAQMARGEFILFLNNDTQLMPGTLEAALETLRSSERVGAVGGKIVFLDGRLQEAGSVLWRHGVPMGLGRGAPADEPSAMFRKEVDYCSACFLLTPRALFLQMGGFHPRYAPSYFEDSDYCLRLWEHGKTVVYEPTAGIVHFESASARSREELLEHNRRNQAKFAEAYKALLDTRPEIGEIDWSLAHFFVGHARLRRRILFVDKLPPLPQFGLGSLRAHRLISALATAGYDVTIAHTDPHHASWSEVYASIDRSVEVVPAPVKTFARFLQERVAYYSDVLVVRLDLLEAVFKSLPRGRSDGGPQGRRPRLVYDLEALSDERRLCSGVAHADVLLGRSPRQAAVVQQTTGKTVFIIGDASDAVSSQSYQKEVEVVFPCVA